MISLAKPSSLKNVLPRSPPRYPLYHTGSTPSLGPLSINLFSLSIFYFLRYTILGVPQISVPYPLVFSFYFLFSPVPGIHYNVHQGTFSCFRYLATLNDCLFCCRYEAPRSWTRSVSTSRDSQPSCRWASSDAGSGFWPRPT